LIVDFPRDLGPSGDNERTERRLRGRRGVRPRDGRAPGDWPWATLLVNVAGAFLLGYFVTRLQERLPLSAYRRPFLGTGVCGGLTTFSTMQIEVLQMLDAGRLALAAAYAIISVMAGFAGVFVATNLVRRTRLTA